MAKARKSRKKKSAKRPAKKAKRKAAAKRSASKRRPAKRARRAKPKSGAIESVISAAEEAAQLRLKLAGPNTFED